MSNIDLAKEIADLKALITKLTPSINRAVSWEEDTTLTGIQLQGPTKVKRYGVLITVCALPGPQGIGVLNIVKNDKNELAIIGAPLIFLD